MAAFEIVLKGLERLRDGGKAKTAIQEAQRRTVERAALATQSKVIAHASGQDLRVRSGAYLRGAEKGFSPGVLTPTGAEASAGIADGPARKYALVQEEGATIRPVNAKLLSIPVGEALTGAGVPRYASPLDVPDSLDPTWIFPKGRRPLFVTRDENDEIEDVLFVGIADSVTIEGKHIVRNATSEVAPLVPQMAREELDRALAQVIGG